MQPGDTCRFVGFSSGLSDVFRDNMLITSVDYSLDQIRIEVEIIKSTLVDFQGQNARKIADINSGGFQITESYT